MAIEEVTVEIGRLRAGTVPLARTPFSSDVIGGDELGSANGQGLAGALSSLPGVTLTNQTGSTAQPEIRVRGFAVSPIVGVPQSISVFVDGVRVNEADASQVHLSLIPLGAIERVELIRGPVGVFGKNSIAGALNFVTRRASGGPTLTAQVEGGSYGSAAGTVSASSVLGSFDGLFVGTHRQSDGWRLLESSEELSLFAKVGWRGERTDAWVSYTFEADSLEGPGPLPESWLNGAPLPPDITDPPSDLRRLQYTGGKGDAFTPRLHFVSSNLSRTLSETWTLQADAFGRFADFRQTNDNLSEPDALGITDIHSVGSTIQLLHRPNERLLLAAGTEWTRNDVDIEIHEVPNRNFPGITPAMTEHLRTDEDNLGAFAEAWWQAGAKVALYGSLRYDYVRLPVRDLLDPSDSGDNTFSEASGGVGLSGELGNGLSAFAGYGRGFRAPVILEVTCADPLDPCQLPFELGPDPPLLPVKSDTWQVGMRVGGEAVQGSVVAYWTEVYDDIFNIVDAVTPTRGYFANLDRTRRVGVEASVTTRPFSGAPGLETSASVGWTRATFQSTAAVAGAGDPGDGPTTVEPGDRFPMVPELSGTVGVTYDLAAATVGVDASWTGSQFLIGDEANEEEFPRLGSNTVVDVHGQWRLGRATVFAELSNVLDHDFHAFGIISENGRGAASVDERFLTPGRPRRLTAGLRVTFLGGA